MNGVVVIITSPDGHVQAVVGDFNQGSPGGMRLEQMQEHRALEKAWREVIDGNCSDRIAFAIKAEEFGMRGVSRRLREQGWRETIRALSIGEEEEGESDD